MQERVFIHDCRTGPYLELPNFCLGFPGQKSAHLCATCATSLPYAERTKTTARVTCAYKWDSFSMCTGIAGTVHAEGIQGVQEALHLLRI